MIKPLAATVIRQKVMKKSTLSRIFRYAWTVAREASNKFGGSPVEYLSEALKMAWAKISSQSDDVTTTCAIIRKTDKAILVLMGGEVWLPISQIKFEYLDATSIEVTMPNWLARKVRESNRNSSIYF